jgi:hypothetical protein
MKKSRNWTGIANDRYVEIDSISGLLATVGSRRGLDPSKFRVADRYVS